ncbi:MAG TPA: hypothetical protein VN703_01665, partial [Candidatus Sulfopaludibacter sp.]|nr:hypothetical protein [Candidatus Sulfopaludibacter sp.]
MGNNGKDVKKYWSTPIGNIVDQTQNEIDNVVEQIKKSQIDYTETINNYQDDAYLRIKNLIDGSLEIQKSFITNLFRLPFTGNYPFLNTLIAIPFQDVIRQMENISDIYAKMLITLLESSNVTVSGIINNTKSTNRDQTNIFIDQLHYNTMQMSQIVNNAMRVVKDLSRTMADETTAKEIENVKKIERYVCINFPRQMSAGETAPLTVIVKNDSRSFLISSPTMVKGIGQIELKVPPNNEEILLLAYFSQEDSKFDLEDKLYCKEINIPVNDEDAQPVAFDLTAKTGGIAKMKIQFFKAAIGGYIGEIPLESIILDTSKPENKSINDYIKELTIPITTGRFHSDVSALNPDMALFILQTKHNESGSEYEVYINSQEIGFRCFGIIPMSNQTKSKFLELFKEIENADMSPDIIDDNVKNIGLQLYKEIIPPDLDRIYWRIRSNIKSIQVWSMEPWIPWEILKPSHKKEDDGLVEEDEFLCERYAFCRWQIGIPPKIKEQLRKVKIIVPSDTKLKGVIEERDWIKEFATSKGLNVSF